jgi:multiple sugar transport system substrate-binding protein
LEEEEIGMPSRALTTHGLRLAPALTVLVLLLAVLGSPPTPVGASAAAAPISLTLASYMPGIGPAAANTLHTMISGFEQAHPGVTVTVEPFSTTSAAGISSQLQQDVVAGKTPDVAQVTFDALRFAVQSLDAQPLDKTIGQAAVSKAFGGDHPFGKAASRLGVIDGHTYVIPWTLSTPILFYNATLLQQAGISSPPSSWEQLQTDAAAIKQKTGADGLSNGCIGSGASGSDWCLQAIVRSDGGQVLDKNKIAFGDSGSVSALTTMQQLAQSGGMVDLTSAQAISEFAAGKLAMYLQTSALQGSLLAAIGNRFQLSDAPLPSFGDKPATPTNSGSGLAMLTTDKAKQKAAWELITWLTDDASETSIAENIGYPPLRPGLVDDTRYLKSWSHAQALLPVNLEQLTRIVPWEAFPGPNFAQIETLFENSASKVVFENANAKQTMQQAQTQAQGLVAGS